MRYVIIMLICVPLMLFGQKKEVRIVGGTEALIDDYPYQVALIDGGQPASTQFCGGTIIHPKLILTATHCLLNVYGSPLSPSGIDVLVGQTDITTNEGKIFQSAQFYIHPNYSDLTSNNDISIIELKDSIDFTDPNLTAGMISIITQNDSINGLTDAGTIATVSGWGRIDNTNYTNILHAVDVPIVSNDTANLPISYNGQVLNTMLAAGYKAGGKDACAGDSGGPLVVEDGITPGNKKLAGIVSWGDGCAEPDKYGIYTRISSYEDWINGIINNLAVEINENNTGATFTIYPNPVENILHYQIDNEPISCITISDCTGKCLLKDNQPSSKISLAALPQGIYIVCLQSGTNKYYKKIIKQ